VRQSRSGFTLVEVLVAVVVLGIGVTALVGSSALVSRMIGRGQLSTRAAQVASRRLEMLRLAASSTDPRCTAGAFADGGPVTTRGVTESWVVPVAGRVRQVTVTVSYVIAKRGSHTEVLDSRIEC